MLRFFVFCLAVVVGTAAATPLQPPVPSQDGPVLLGPYLEKLVDPGAKLGIDDVRSNLRNAEFKRNLEDVPNLGYSPAALWLRFRLPRDLPIGEEFLLEIRWPNLDRIEFYIPQPVGQDGVRYRRLVVGDRLPWNVRDVKDQNFVVRLAATTTSIGDDIYLRVTSEGAVTVPIYLWRPDAFASHSRSSQIGFGVFYGLMLALILYNLMLFVSVRDHAYLHYVLYAIAFAIALLCFDGIAFEYFGPEGQWWPNNGLTTFFFLSLFFGGLFVRAFLGTPGTTPRSDRLVLALAGISGVLAICAIGDWLFSYREMVSSISALAILSAFLTIIVGVRAMLSGYRGARFFLLAWGLLLVGLVSSALRSLGVLPYNLYTTYSLHIGVASDLVLLSFALADRINLLKRESELVRTEARAVEIASRQKSELLLRVLPQAVIPRLQAGESPIADQFADVTVVFADIVGFTPLSERLGPKRMVFLLNDLFARFDLAASRLGVEKIETTGDGYLAVGGAPDALDNHPAAVAEFALAIVDAASKVSISETEHVQIRVGIHTGPIFAGVIGESRFHYKIFGETVNTASRIQGHAQNGRVLVSESTFRRLQDKFDLEKYGVVELKGHGPMQSYWLVSQLISKPTQNAS